MKNGKKMRAGLMIDYSEMLVYERMEGIIIENETIIDKSVKVASKISIYGFGV